MFTQILNNRDATQLNRRSDSVWKMNENKFQKLNRHSGLPDRVLISGHSVKIGDNSRPWAPGVLASIGSYFVNTSVKGRHLTSP